jgi:GH15 family glucan-1,4-alpha-glucosidase
LTAEQHPGGGFLASPRFPTYAYSWLRDGSFIAYSLLRWNRADACRRFLDWVAGVITARASSVGAVEAALAAGRRPEPQQTLPTRYTVEGGSAEDDWPNFQIDGYGTWLWLLDEYLKASDAGPGLPERWRPAVELSLRYLKAVWTFPNFDCWEENGEGVHPSTLACVYGGVNAMAGRTADPGHRAWADEIRAFVLATRLPDGRFPKSLGNPAAEASLLWLSLPFGVVDVGHPSMQATAARIESDLLRQGGVQRYAKDTYYGGGRWVLLSAWLAWYWLKVGRQAEAEELLTWVEAQADSEGGLPEQVAQAVNDPSFVPVWEHRWGPSASPLLWSHAMYLVALAEHPQFLTIQRRIP